MKKVKYEYSDELDIIHVYSSEIDKGIKGCLNVGNFNLDISGENKVVGMEIESASKILKLSPESLSNLNEVDLIVRKAGNFLCIGIFVQKGSEKSRVEFNLNAPRNMNHFCIN